MEAGVDEQKKRLMKANFILGKNQKKGQEAEVQEKKVAIDG